MRRLYFLLIILLSFLPDAYAQDSLVVYTKRNFKGDRPKIGLVLSGGGAKGIAHVGFLQVMEEAGIHPDYITGTSMGSIVGALYAIGFSVDSIKHMIEAQNWTEILSNQIDFRRVNMEEKPDYGEYFAELPVHGWKPGLPSGAIKGQQLELLFEKLTISVAEDTSFDEFYIPYRAVATDLLTGKPYVFSSGPLALAMRSSMSIPTIMQPIKY
jgi:NTE family protein